MRLKPVRTTTDTLDGGPAPGPPRSAEPMLTRADVGLFALGAAVSAAYALVLYSRQTFIQPTIDLNGFGKIGRSLAEGRGFSLGYGPTLRRAPLYPGLVAAILLLTGYSPAMSDAVAYRPVVIVQCCLVGLCCVATR